MSNQEFLDAIQTDENHRDQQMMGNAIIHNRYWQRRPGKDGAIRGLINELISETSSNMEQNSNEQYDLKPTKIDVGVKDKKLYADIDDFDFEDISDSKSASDE